MKKGSRSCLDSRAPRRLRLRRRLLLATEVRELVAELLDPAAERIDALLGAGVERVRLARRLELVERQLAAVVHLDRLARLRARAGDELEAVGEIDEADFAIRGVDAFFHGMPLRWCREPRRAEPLRGALSEEPMIVAGGDASS